MDAQTYIEQQARQRVETTELDSWSDIIFYDWPNWTEHMQWIATAPIVDIVDWAATVDVTEG